jgi:hypothetical protein
MYEDRDPNQPEPWEANAADWNPDKQQTPAEMIQEAKSYLVSLKRFVESSITINWENVNADGVAEELVKIEKTLATHPTESIEQHFLKGVVLLATAPQGAPNESIEMIRTELEKLIPVLEDSYACEYVLNATRAVQALTT